MGDKPQTNKQTNKQKRVDRAVMPLDAYTQFTSGRVGSLRMDEWVVVTPRRRHRSCVASSDALLQ